MLIRPPMNPPGMEVTIPARSLRGQAGATRKEVTLDMLVQTPLRVSGVA